MSFWLWRTALIKATFLCGQTALVSCAWWATCHQPTPKLRGNAKAVSWLQHVGSDAEGPDGMLVCSTQLRMYRLVFLFIELEYNQSVSFLWLTLVKNFLVSLAMPVGDILQIKSRNRLEPTVWA